MADSKNKSGIWKSLKEYYQDPVVLKNKTNEFMDGVTDDFDPDELSKVSRRKFLALMTASAAFTATACTDYHDKGEVIAYNDRPEGVIPGKPNYYASTCDGCAVGCGVLVKTREGRPIKLDGNPDHPVNKGKLCTKGQAGILELYDPDRLTDPLRDRRKVSWNDVDAYMVEAFAKYASEGKEIAFVTGENNSPAFGDVIAEFAKKYPTVKVYNHAAFSEKNRRSAWKKVYGSGKYPAIKWADADVIVSLDADLLGNEGDMLEFTREFAKRRDAVNGADFNRFYVVEGGMTLTGANADYRIRVNPQYHFELALLVLNQVAMNLGVTLPSNLAYRKSVTDFELAHNIKSDKVARLITDLLKNRGKSIFYVGRDKSEDLHMVANYLNEILGNSALYNFKCAHTDYSTEDISVLVSNINRGAVGAVLHVDVNPVYNYSGNTGYEEALAKVPTKVSFTLNRNETSEKCNFVLPVHHYLEAWGDIHSRENIYTLRQPVINPIFNTRQSEAAILQWADNSTGYNQDKFHKFLQNSFKKNVYAKAGTTLNFKKYWFNALHDGIVMLPANETVASINVEALGSVKTPKTNEGFTLQVRESYFVGDGKFANNGWLQETPHPVSKVTWDNYAAIAPATAAALGVENNDLIDVSADGNSISLPVMIQPGTAENTILTEAGYGRTIVGEVGLDVGFDVYKFGSEKLYSNVDVKKGSGTYDLVSTQEHHSLDDESVKDFHRIRGIIQDGTVEEYKKDPKFLKHHEHDIFSITDSVEYKGVKWAMAIDLNKCTSCSACVTSCNVENNIPVVGKDQVSRGREMSWMRIDRYYSGSPEEPVVSNQPMLCQHCDNAPCENVCPVNATNHSPDGLNQMAYNRCVGTRYCANNCPYKVRRFNFYNFRDHFADAYYQNDLTYLASNPEVTVRSRGVMEKCTFCIQKIMDAREVAIRENRDLKGDDVVTACQQACPSEAIVFGDSNDPESTVSKYREHDLGYHVLDLLNVRPNVTYIAKLRNTHSEDA